VGEIHTVICAVLFLNLTVKLHYNLLIFDEVTDKTKLAPFYGSRCSYVTYVHRFASYWLWTAPI